MQELAHRAGTPEPLDMELAIQQLLERHQKGPIRWAFYLIVDMMKAELAWQHGLDRALGAPASGLTLQEYFQRIHPDYAPMYVAWANAVNQAGFQMCERVRDGQFVYHICLPLRHSDGRYYWFTQRSFALQADAQGRYISHFNLYDYGGPWSVHSRRPFLPFITNHSQPDTVLEGLLFSLMADQIKARFTPTEAYLLEWYMAGEPPRKVRMGAETRHEHNAHMLQKARSLFCCDFPSARAFARFLGEQGLWPPQDVFPPGGGLLH